MAPVVPDVPPVHTDTHQWQSFEMRMRQRRIDRLLARGEAAVEARDADAAREVFEELDHLEPGSLRVAALRTRLTEPIAETPAVDAMAGTFLPPVDDFELRSIDEIPRERSPRIGSLPAVAAVILLLGGIAWFAVPRKSSPMVAGQVPQVTSTPLARADDTTEPTPAAPPEVQVAVSDVTAAKTVEELPAVDRNQDALPTTGRTTPPAALPGEATALRTDIRLAPAAAVVEASREAIPPPVPMTAAPSLESTPPPSPPSVPPAPVPSLAAAPAPSTVPDMTSSAPRPIVPDDAGVRATLARYEAAYSRLDADAVGAVWPGLDRRALAHAFDGLESQRVNLGSCDVRIAGETAVAECSGSAIWTPKVGGGSRNQPRRWQFRLRNTAGSWQIVGATTR